MKILVPVKRVIDPYVKIRVKPTEDGVETAHVKHAMNPFDEIAIEEALRLVEKGVASEVIAVTIGPEVSQEILRHALALGAHRSILVETDTLHPSLHIAKILQAIVKQESPDLVLMGKQTIDGDNNQTAQMLAALLDVPQATFASAIEVSDNQLSVTREVDAGLETLKITLPAVVSTDLRLNEPRYASLPNIMKAKQKPLDKLALTDLGLDLKPHAEVISVKSPPVRQSGIKVASVDELLSKLRDEEQVL
ncbi:MAG: electron transfer flavoprotein subunit beta/FixA family protein [Legionellaceae bacterium]|nr:electron transfer flavoprotein subunit beta/FixA family protein [Legionellaceae bacterium]